MFDPKLFERKADVRGIYPNDLNEELAFHTGRYLVQHLVKKTPGSQPAVLVGRDGRTSSPAIYRAVIEGIGAAGGTPLAAGLCTTDMVQWAVGKQLGGAVAGAMITASHNPPEYNGVKMVALNGETGSVDMVRPVEHLQPFYLADGSDSGAAPATHLPYSAGGRFQLQRDFVAAACARNSRLAEVKGKIVIDPGNGVGGILVPLLQEELKRVGSTAEIVTIFGEIDGRFPNRPSNPGLPGAVRELQKTVRETGAEFGVALDGDADRMFLVDERGEFVPGSQLLAALGYQALQKADSQLSRKPIVFANVASFCVIDAIRRGGGLPVYCRVGQDSAKEAITSTKAVFGGESSAHYNFPDTYCLDSGLFSLMMFWELLLDAGESCSAVLKPFAQWPCSGEINLRIQTSDWKSMSQQVITMLRQKYAADIEDCYVSELDGLAVYHPRDPRLPTVGDLFQVDPEGNPAGDVYRFVAPDYRPKWWLSVRASNNEPLLRINYECKHAGHLESETKKLVDEIHQFCTNGGAAVSMDSGGNLAIALG